VAKDPKAFNNFWMTERVREWIDKLENEAGEKIAASQNEEHAEAETLIDEGNDPEKTGRSFGTPHDLASMNILGREYSVTNQEKMVKPPSARASRSTCSSAMRSRAPKSTRLPTPASRPV
jgi:hypothetical protein